MIRAAESRDFAKLIELGRSFNIEAGHEADIPFVDADFALTLEILANANMLKVFDDGSGPVGMGAGDIAPAICNRSIKIGREAFWFVDPAHRQGAGKQLLSALELAAQTYGAHIFDVVAETGKRSDALGRLYRAAGYNSAEITYRKKLS